MELEFTRLILLKQDLISFEFWRFDWQANPSWLTAKYGQVYMCYFPFEIHLDRKEQRAN